MPSDTDLAYLAGVLDSDGYIGIVKSPPPRDGVSPAYSVRVSVKQVEIGAIDLAHSLFPGTRFVRPPTSPRGKPLEVWDLNNQRAAAMLRAVRPYLHIKRAQADNAVAAADLLAIPRRRTLPAVVEGEALVTMKEAAELTGRSLRSIRQAVTTDRCPVVRKGRSVFLPLSFMPSMMERRSAIRSVEVTGQLEVLYLRAKQLNKVGAH